MAHKQRSKFFCIILLVLCVSPLAADSLWPKDVSHSLFADAKTKTVGDLITVLIAETTTATQQAASDFKKDVSHKNAAGLGSILGLIPKIEFSSAQDGAAAGQTTMSANLLTKITATVVGFTPAGNPMLAAAKTIVTNGEKQEVKLSATVRTEDISTDNTVLSTSLADVQITYTGKGPVGDRQHEGIISKLIKYIF